MKNCSNCKYSDKRPWGLVCMGQKNEPRVEQNESCEDWKSACHTLADGIRAMNNKELASYLNQVETDGRCGILRGRNGWLERLEQEY